MYIKPLLTKSWQQHDFSLQHKWNWKIRKNPYNVMLLYLYKNKQIIKI